MGLDDAGDGGRGRGDLSKEVDADRRGEGEGSEPADGTDEGMDERGGGLIPGGIKPEVERAGVSPSNCLRCLKLGDDAEGVVLISGRGGGVYTKDGVWDSPSGLLTIYRRDLPLRDENCESEALDSPYVASPHASSLALLFGEPGGVI